MATLTLTVNDSLLPTLRALAGERGYPATNAGAREMVKDDLRKLYREYRHLEAQRQVAPTVDGVVAQANTEAEGIT